MPPITEKKKSPDSARHLSYEDDNPQSSCNSDSHEIHPKSANQLTAEPQLASDDEASTLDTIRHDAFPVPACASFASNG